MYLPEEEDTKWRVDIKKIIGTKQFLLLTYQKDNRTDD